MTNDPAREPERDAWLSEALRHAPDAQAAPPAALSDAILRQARAAASAPRARKAAPARSRWRALWDALAQPSVAAGFASVMVATVVGVMWWGQPMDSTIVRAPAVDATPPAAAPAPSRPEAPPAGPVTVPAPSPDRAARSMASPPPSDAAALDQRAAPKPAPKRAAPAAAPSTGSPPAVAPAQRREEPEAFADRRSASEAAAPAPPSSVTAAPAPLTPRPREPDAPVAADSKLEAARDEARAMGSGSAAARSAVPQAAVTAALRADNPAAARPATLNALLASIAAQPERWTWERGGTPQPLTPALRRWLAQVEAATAATRPRTTADGTATGEAALLRLYRDGVLTATLRLDAESVGLVSGPRTALPPAGLAPLKQGLDEATR